MRNNVNVILSHLPPLTYEVDPLKVNPLLTVYPVATPPDPINLEMTSSCFTISLTKAHTNNPTS